MKPYSPVLLAVAAMAVLTGCTVNISNPTGWSDRDLKAATNLLQSAEIPADLKSLDVENAFGAIHITGDDNGPYRWSQKLAVRARTDKVVQQLAGALVCRAQLTGDHLALVVMVPETREPHNFQSDLEITVPKSVAVETHDQYGRTEIGGINGEVKAANKFGVVELRDLNGKVRAETSYAALNVRHTGPPS